MAKKLSQYGIELLDELKKDRSKFRKGEIDGADARSIAQLANSTGRIMRETLNSKKFEIALQ